MTDADRLAQISASDEPYALLEHHLGDVIGHRLFTLMVIDRTTNEAARVYTSNPTAYPVKGRKPLGDLTDWGTQVLSRAEPFIGRTADDIRSVFPDHETISALGCASVLNLPVTLDGITLGTVNLLHEAEWYTPNHAVRGAPFAALMGPHFLAWANP